MMNDSFCRIIAGEIQARPEQVDAAVRLLDEGNTVPFIARYRKEITGGLDDTQLRNLETRLSYLRELEALEKSLSHMDHLDSCYYKMSTLYYGISVTEKTIEWCRHIREGKVLKELTAK